MMHRQSLTAFATVLVLAVLTLARPANADFGLPGMAAEFDGWRYIPIFEDGDVHSFVVLDTDPDPLGTNITSMWFIRDGASWSGYSWRTSDQKAALTDVKNTLGLSDETDPYWPVDPSIQPDGTAPTTTKEPLATGVFPDDPLLPVIESQTDPTELPSVLVSAGWEASDADLFKSECRQDQLLSDMADGFVLELAEDGAGVDVIGDAIDDTVCQGGGGGGGCTPRTIIGGVWQSGCVDTTGWVLTGTGTGVTMGQCWPENCWSGAFFHYERCRVRKIYANCTTCLMVQQRFNNCTASVCELDTSTPLGPPPCGAVPPGYTPPAGPSIGSPCTAANPDCEGWTDWSPDVEDVCP